MVVMPHCPVLLGGTRIRLSNRIVCVQRPRQLWPDPPGDVCNRQLKRGIIRCRHVAIIYTAGSCWAPAFWRAAVLGGAAQRGLERPSTRSRWRYETAAPSRAANS